MKQVTAPVKSTTQNFVEIIDIKDDVVLMKDKSAALVIEISAVNSWLLSSEEQTSMIYSYAELLNSLSFPVQILIISKKMDISSYLDYLDNHIEKQKQENIKNRLINYREFIKNIVKKNTVLEKRFFFIIPFNPLEMGVSGANAAALKNEYVFVRAKTALYPKRDHLLRLLSKIGLKGNVLKKQELVELFLNLYNPSPTGRKLAPVESYNDIILTPG
jgi:hypothetical protein